MPKKGVSSVGRARRARLLLEEEGHCLPEVGARAAAKRHDAVDAISARLGHGLLDDGGGDV
jgi:hypothetical protein